THVAQICLFLLCEARIIPGALLQTAPPRGDEPAHGSWRRIDLDLSRYDRLAQRHAARAAYGLAFLKAGIATESPTYNALIAEIERVAGVSRAPLLLTGPTGAGKTRLARRIYELKRARHLVAGAFVEVNCATLRGDGAMSTLFGHTRGAFTGAREARDGLLRRADGGVLFLDEIGELGLDEQAMLLRAIEEGRFLPLGADREVESRFQLIAGTNRDLHAQVTQGRFREDLLARIDLWHWHLPGLRDRLEDLPPNLAYELGEFERREGRRVTFSREARAAFLAFATGPDATWRGNFRDLNAAVTRMATLAPGGRIDGPTVEAEQDRLARAWGGAAPAGEGEALLLEALGPAGVAGLDRFDRVQLADVLAVCKRSPSLSAAGRVLFAVSRAQRKSVNDADRLRKYL
ncbi:MAG: sigma 54-interacting transcriptional regulator, partial [Myxococcales bacterium]|nr:sigma 54-interacting transcriptional regulator [Myxococcales bacterium]